MATQETEYANTDLVLCSNSSIETLTTELQQSCRVMYCTHGDDGRWYATIESGRSFDSIREAVRDIIPMLAAFDMLTPTARAEFERCDIREFNIGFHCWDSWGYNHALPNDLLQAIAAAGCSLSITLYPMRQPDGTPKI